MSLQKTEANSLWVAAFGVSCFIAIAFLSAIDQEFEMKNSRVTSLSQWMKPFPRSRRSIIFVESASSSTLNIRQACAVESAARWNTNMNVLVFMTSPPQNSQPILRMLREEFGANIVYSDPSEVFHGTPLERWYAKGDWNASDFKIGHLSDAMRLSLLWHLGGIYLDLDIVVQRPLDSLHNAILTESDDYLCNAVMAFQPRHGFLSKCLVDFEKNYNASTWIENGPVLVTRVIHEYCGVNHTEKVKDTDCDVNVLPAEVGYALEWQKWQWFFQAERKNQVLRLFNESLLVHMWNSQSFRWKIQVGSNCAFDELFRTHCPSVYSHVVGSLY